MKYNLYDFDGTIYDGDSGIDIIIYAIKKYPKFIFIAGWSVILYVFKLINKKQFKSKMFSFVKYIDDMDKFVEGFWCKNEKKLKEFWLAKSSHKNDIIISASGDFWLKYIAEKYKVADLFATIYDLKNGEISGNNCHGEEKVKLFYERYPDGVIFSMYTDSENDRPLIEKAIHGYFVKKDKILPAKEVKKTTLGKIKKIKNNEIFCYLVVGALTVLVNLVVKWLLLILLDESNAFELQLSVIFSWGVAVVFAYFANRIYVFKSVKINKVKEFMLFLGSRISTLIVEMLLTWTLITVCDFNIYVMMLFIQFVIIVLNYIFSKMFVFKK